MRLLKWTTAKCEMQWNAKRDQEMVNVCTWNKSIVIDENVENMRRSKVCYVDIWQSEMIQTEANDGKNNEKKIVEESNSKNSRKKNVLHWMYEHMYLINRTFCVCWTP